MPTVDSGSPARFLLIKKTNIHVNISPKISALLIWRGPTWYILWKGIERAMVKRIPVQHPAVKRITSKIRAAECRIQISVSGNRSRRNQTHTFHSSLISCAEIAHQTAQYTAPDQSVSTQNATSPARSRIERANTRGAAIHCSSGETLRNPRLYSGVSSRSGSSERASRTLKSSRRRSGRQNAVRVPQYSDPYWNIASRT